MGGEILGWIGRSAGDAKQMRLRRTN